MSDPIVIVGTGLAGYNLAKEFRKLDSQTPLLLISSDDARSYSKPMLSTGFAKDKDADALVLADVPAMAEQLNALIRSHSEVTGIDPGHQRLWLGEEAIYYRDLVLAWGAEPIRVPVSGDALECILPVNDLADYARFRTALAGKSKVLILGAGLIGCEFANDLRLGGLEVELVAPCEQVMPGLLPEPCAHAVQNALEALGAHFHLGPVLAKLNHDNGRLRAELSDGQIIVCDLVLSAVGLRPRTALAEEAGLECGRGIRVDRLLQSSHSNIYALGDCAEVDGLNLLYVMPLMAAARALAQTLAGRSTPVSYGPMPVTVKTPACPLVVSPPPRGHAGQWQIEGQAPNLKAQYLAADDALLGYALTGECVVEKMALNKLLPTLLA